MRLRESIRVLVVVTTCSLGMAVMPVAAAPDDASTPLTAAYARVVKPGEQADTYRELLGIVLARVQRSFALEVDVPAFIAAALTVLEPLSPGAGEPVAVFKSAVNAALASLDPH